MSNNKGAVIQVMGPVLDIRFSDAGLPDLLNAIEIPHGDNTIVAEVAQHIGDNVVRCIAMSSTDGLQRGAEAIDTGAPISVPVGDECLGRVFNLLGQPIDNKEAVKGAKKEAVKGAKKEAVKGAKKEAVKGAKKEAVKGAKKEAVKGAKKEAVKGAKKEAVKAATKETVVKNTHVECRDDRAAVKASASKKELKSIKKAAKKAAKKNK